MYQTPEQLVALNKAQVEAALRFAGVALEGTQRLVDLQLKDVRQNLKDKGIELEVSEGLLDHLGTEGFDPIFGARPLRRVIQNEVEDKLSDALLEGEYVEGDTLRLDYVDSEVTIEKIASSEPEPALTS